MNFSVQSISNTWDNLEADKKGPGRSFMRFATVQLKGNEYLNYGINSMNKKGILLRH